MDRAPRNGPMTIAHFKHTPLVLANRAAVDVEKPVGQGHFSQVWGAWPEVIKAR
jgi:hypothetical protein